MSGTINHKSTTSIICALRVNEHVEADATEARRLRSLISGHIKTKFPLRVFETVVEDNILRIHRIADLISE
jgi:hypothetical protein